MNSPDALVDALILLAIIAIVGLQEQGRILSVSYVLRFSLDKDFPAPNP